MPPVVKDAYFVAVKAFLEREGQLLILKDKFGPATARWDLPGGRITAAEFKTPLEDILRRKMREELGEGIAYAIGEPVVFMRHERVEATPEKPLVRIFAIGYEAKLEEGEAHLSSAHTEMQWVDIKTFKPEDYFSGGWLAGVKEYLALRRR
ncbi:MAG: NUDIX domain-containing protein [Candidatus Liptonbacteria bacterium]|nr:NUDIX domain-containing protein [Candidatus Liptonbacteria bacterium]